jgi:hypothetical protein
LVQGEVRYQRNPDYIFRQIIDELVLVPVRQDVADMDAIYTLNEVGAFIWRQLEGPRNLDALQVAVLAEYDAEAATVTSDVAAFVDALLAIGAVHEV